MKSFGWFHFDRRRLFWFHQWHIFCKISSFISCLIASFPCKKNKSMVLLNHVDKSILLYYLKFFNNTTRAFTLRHLEIPNPTDHSFRSPKFHVYDRYTARSSIWKETSCKWERWTLQWVWHHDCTYNKYTFFKIQVPFRTEQNHLLKM